MSNRAKKGISSAAAMGLGLLGGIMLWWWWNRRMEEVEEYLEPRRREALAMPPMQHERVGPVGDVTTEGRFEASYTPPGPTSFEPEPLQESQLEEPVATAGTRAAELDIVEIDVEPLEEAQVTMETTETVSEPAPAAGEPAIPSPPERDNFTVLEGIGPVVNELLHSAGIDTFEELARTDVNRLAQILSDAELPMINPGTWPEQAELAAAENWDALNDLKNELSGGRRRAKVND